MKVIVNVVMVMRGVLRLGKTTLSVLVVGGGWDIFPCMCILQNGDEYSVLLL